MTEAQHKQHKLGNAIRRMVLMNSTSTRNGRGLAQSVGGYIQESKYTQAARQVILRRAQKAAAKKGLIGS